MNQLCLVPSSQSEGQTVTVPLEDLIAQRIEHVKAKYDGREIPDRTVVDRFSFFTVEDRPLVKERTTEYLDTQLLVREFAKQVRLVSVRELPKHSEKLKSEVVILTADAASANPWLADRVVHNTSASSLPVTEQNPTASSTDATTLSLRGGGDAGPSKSRNPFKRFIKGKSSSKGQGSSVDKTPPASPQPGTPVTPVSANNPFGTSVKSNEEQAEPSAAGAVVPAASRSQNESGKQKKSLKWFFSAPFSGAKDKAGATEPAAGMESSESLPPKNLDPQTQAAKKPTMEPFLDQSVSNSELGKDSWNVVSHSEAEQPVGQPTKPTSPQLPTKVAVPESVPSEPISSTSGNRPTKFTPLSEPEQAVPPSSTAPRPEAPQPKAQPVLEPSKPAQGTGQMQGQALTSAALRQREEASSSKPSKGQPRTQIPMARHTFERPTEGQARGLYYSSASQGGSSDIRSNPVEWTSSGSELSFKGESAPATAPGSLTDHPLLQNAGAGSQASSSRAMPATAGLNSNVSTAKVPAQETTQRSVSSGTARSPRSGQILDSVNEFANASQSEGVLPRSTVLEKAYNAALVKSMEFVPADKQRATLTARTGGVDESVEYFYQIEEIKTRREVVETFAVHQHVLLEHVIETVYFGERRSAATIEMLSSRVLMVDVPYYPA